MFYKHLRWKRVHAVKWLDHFSVHLLQHEPQVHTDVTQTQEKEGEEEWQSRMSGDKEETLQCDISDSVCMT